MTKIVINEDKVSQAQIHTSFHNFMEIGQIF